MNRSFQMTVDEILVSYRQSKNKGQQVVILSQLNSCATWEIVWVLVENGIDPRSFNKVATLRNAYEKAKEKGLQLPKKSVSEIVEEIQPEEAPEQEDQLTEEEKAVMDECTIESLTDVIEDLQSEHPVPDQSEEDSRIVNIPVDSFASEEPEEIQIPEETVMLESYEKTIETLNKEIAYLQEKNKEYLEKIQELHESARRSKEEALELREEADRLISENSDLKKSLEHHKVSDFNATADSMQMELEVKKLKEHIRFLEDEAAGDKFTINEQIEKVAKLSDKLTRCEQYILNLMVYDS